MTLTDHLFFWGAIAGIAWSMTTIFRVFLVMIDKGRWF